MAALLELQGAIVAALKGDSAVASIVGAKVYDEVPPAPAYPYLSIGAVTELQDDADCIEATEVSFRLDAWSNAVGFPEVTRLADAVRSALRGFDPTLATAAVASFEHRRTDRLRDPGGLVKHAAIEFVATLEYS